jgi:lysophospholipase L1-like esterase
MVSKRWALVLLVVTACSAHIDANLQAGGAAGQSSGAAGANAPLAAAGKNGAAGMSNAGTRSGAGTGGMSGTGGARASGTGGTSASGTGGAGASGTGASGTGGAGGAGATDPGIIAAGVRWIGRVDTTDPNKPRFAWSGSGFVAEFSGTSLSVQLDTGNGFVFKAVVDDVPQPPLTTSGGQGTYMIASGLAAGVHTVALYRQSEGQEGDTTLLQVTVGGGALRPPPTAPDRLIEIVGNSISCGYGDLGTSATCSFSLATESHWDSYEAVAARALDAELSTIAVSGRGVYRNNDGSMTDTMPDHYERALTNDATPTWSFAAEPQAVVIELGTNDFAKGDPGTAFTTAYVGFTGTVRMKYPHALILLVIGPMMSDDYPQGQQQLTKIRNDINSVISMRNGEGDHDLDVLEFTVDGSSDQGCDYHPNVKKHQQMGDALAAKLKAKLGW